ncbi:MAG: nitrogen regulation protein NR(I) [Burkholderiaceae bacterium]
MDGVWIVDDDQSIRWVLERALLREGFAVRTFERADDCLAALRSDRPRVLLSDIRMPGTDGIELLKQVRSNMPGLPVIIMTAFSDLDSAVSSFQTGAFEYLTKPFDLGNALDLVRRAVEQRPTGMPPTEAATTELGLLGNAPAMQEVYRAIGRLSGSVATVLVTGESGTGKELVARALHQHSDRSEKPFIAINTAAIPPELLESELFGHERGAFTGAQQQRKGRFEQAAGGTLFLDEIGDMPPELQTRLLRVLSDGNFFRVGGAESIASDVRVIAATHQALEERVRNGQFREDLFHRLNVIRLRLPGLRERREDIPLLARHFLQTSARKLGGEPKQLTDPAIAVMQAFDWPGNVRQLENVCHWLTVMAPAQVVGPGDLPPDLRMPADANQSLSQPLSQPLSQTVNQSSGGSVASGITSTLAAGVQPQPTTATSPNQWSDYLAQHVAHCLAAQPDSWSRDDRSDLMAELTRQFESAVLMTTLRHTRGRRIDAAYRLGVGRNTITRKIQELNLDA